MTKKQLQFQNTVWGFYGKHKRGALPWRKKVTPYCIWVSEIMLQQTQVDRVIPFFENWMKLFPTVQKLATAPQSDVLRAWKGLGYNSRALRMKKTAQIICEGYGKKFPKTYDELIQLPGIGPYTAGALMAFSYNESIVMIETNIRRVYIHHFYPLHDSGEGGLRSKSGEDRKIHDKELMELIKNTLPKENFREWYWALMDYGSYLGKTIPNPNKKSKHYVVQKKFKGSDREIRGKILEILLKKKKISEKVLLVQLNQLLKNLAMAVTIARLNRVLASLEREGFLTKLRSIIRLV